MLVEDRPGPGRSTVVDDWLDAGSPLPLVFRARCLAPTAGRTFAVLGVLLWASKISENQWSGERRLLTAAAHSAWIDDFAKCAYQAVDAISPSRASMRMCPSPQRLTLTMTALFRLASTRLRTLCAQDFPRLSSRS
ncbi:hypothetical protein [Lentzea albida]|uniref:hypothetical protein n=1 Tax=Lentzea albida TaxID=65499 RepID=UPI0015A6B4EA|nr:hypothetical protein [Lentzea albida]